MRLTCMHLTLVICKQHNFVTNHLRLELSSETINWKHYRLEALYTVKLFSEEWKNDSCVIKVKYTKTRQIVEQFFTLLAMIIALLLILLLPFFFYQVSHFGIWRSKIYPNNNILL